MANLTALREKIKNITDYSPELQQFNDQLDELINDAFYQIWTTKKWNFATKVVEFPFHPDITPTRDNENTVSLVNPQGIPVNASCTLGDRRITFSHSIDRLITQGIGVWEGCPIEIQGMEYIISKVLSGSAILLEREFLGTTKVDDVSWKIKKRYYNLPEDCAELLYIGQRDFPFMNVAGTVPPYGKQTGLYARREEEFGLRADYAMSYSEAYIPSPSENIIAAERLLIDDAGEGIMGDLDRSYHEFCWAFYKNGKVGPLSEPTIYKIKGNTNAITMTFVSWDSKEIYADSYTVSDKKPTQWEGYRKKIYYNKNLDHDTGERLGLPCWVEVVNGGTTRDTASYLSPVLLDDTISQYNLLYENQMDNGSKRYIEIDGSHQRIRPYPRPDGWDIEVPHEENVSKITTSYHDYIRTGILRYYRKPLDLLLATDSPEMPFEFHQLIVYKALEIIYLKLGDAGMAGTYEKKYDKQIKELEKRYVDKVDVQPVRSQFGIPSTFRGYNSSDLKYGG